MSSDLLDIARDFGDLAASAGEFSQKVPGLRTAVKGFCRIAAGTPGPAILGALNIGTVCDPYLAEDGRTFGGPAPPPFQGGQCQGAAYSVTWNAFAGDTQVVTNRTEQATGPITIDSTPSSLGSPRRRILGNGEQVQGSVVVGNEENPPRIDILSINRTDGQPDDCGDPPAEFVPGDGYGGEDYGEPQVITGPDGNDYNITIGPPSGDGSGGISIPVNIDGIELNLGDPAPVGTPPGQPNFDDPVGVESPGPGGGAGGGDNPPDGIDSMTAAAAVTIEILSEPPNASREVGGPENIFVAGSLFDAGWFRWRIGQGFSPEYRITSRTMTVIFSPGECAESDGYQVKFSFGFSGRATVYQCSTTEA